MERRQRRLPAAERAQQRQHGDTGPHKHLIAETTGAGHSATKDNYGAKSILECSEVEAQMLYSTEKHRKSVGLSQSFY